LDQALTLSLAHAAKQAGDSLALITDEGEYSFAQLYSRMQALAGRSPLRELLGERRMIAIRAHNSLAILLAFYAAIDSGSPMIVLHPRLTDAECLAQLAQFGLTQWLGDHELALLAAQTDQPRLSSEPPSYTTVDAESALAYLFTSGTSGTPKAATLSRRAFCASACASEQNLGWTKSDRWLLCLPVCHVGGLSIVTRCLLGQKPVRLLHSFDETRVLAAIERDACTMLSVVPTMLRRLLRADQHNVLSRLRVLLVGGAATPEALVDECAARAIALRTTYGMTEAASQITTQRARKPSTVEYGYGPVLEGAQLRVLNADGGACAPNEVGNIVVRGPMLFSGYYGQSGHLAQDWFVTGDLGCLDSYENLQVFSRTTELIITGGENVYPLEVERALERLSGVRAAMVFAQPDPEWGHRVCCALVVTHDFSRDVFARECRVAMAAHKRPRALVLTEALPVNAAGKLDRALAARQFAGQLLDI
jgi:O-succinylbenzoic acid--CoA ligase